MRRALALLLLFVVVPARAEVDPDAPSLRLLVKKDDQVVTSPRVKVGEPFHIVVAVTPRPDVVVNLPASFDSAPFEVVERKETSGVAGGVSERQFVLTVVAWDVGQQTFPGVPVTYVSKGAVKQIQTDALSVQVDTVIVDPEKEGLAPIAGPVSVMQRDWRLVWIAGSIAGSLLVAGVTLLLARSSGRRRRARAAAPVVDLRTPDQIALDRLRALGASVGNVAIADPRPFYFALTEIVREYLGKRYGFEALELTTSELLEALKKTSLEQGIHGELEGWLAGCDFVKYAKMPAGVDEARKALAEAVGLVERTRPPPPPPAPAVKEAVAHAG